MLQTPLYLNKEVNQVLGHWTEAVDSSKGSDIISTSKLLQDPIAVEMNLNNGASSSQNRTSSVQSRTSVRKPYSINTTLAVISNIGH
eukprot:14857026-Ditylum_brightwellii.AAC.1